MAYLVNSTIGELSLAWKQIIIWVSMNKTAIILAKVKSLSEVENKTFGLACLALPTTIICD